MKKTLSILIILMVTILACKKSDIQEPDKSVISYQPVSKGTYWKYDHSARTTLVTSIRTMTGEKDVLNGKTYYKFSVANSNGSTQSAYYGQNNGDYYLYEVIPGMGGFETLFLKENAAVGESWTSDAGGLNGVRYRIVGKTIEKGITYVVGGQTYDNVIHTQLLTQYSASGSDVFNNVQTLNYYICKGIGIIEAGDATGSPSIKIMEYSIK